MTDTPPTPPVRTIRIERTVDPNGWTAKTWLSERMVFGLLIIFGYIALLFTTPLWADRVPAWATSILSSGLGTLGAAIGVIVAAIWKQDKADKQSADTLAKVVGALPQNPDQAKTP